MANPVTQITLGVDVAKNTLFIHLWEQDSVLEIANEPQAVQSWLKSLNGIVSIAVEPTSHYHQLLVESALTLGYSVYLVSPRQLSHYRSAVNL